MYSITEINVVLRLFIEVDDIKYPICVYIGMH